MREGIRVRPLGDVCDILDSRRKPITKRNRVSGPYPYYGATGILDYVESYIFDEPLVLIGEDGAKWGAGESTAYAVEGKCWVNNHAHVIRPNRNLMLDAWVIYYLNAIDLAPFISGLTVPKLNQGRLREIPIPLPPIPEQKRIVAILDEAFTGITTAVANTEKNLANARELFESYLNSVFLKGAHVWTRRRLEEVCEKITVGHVGSMAQRYKPEGIPLLRSQNIRPFRVDLENVVYIDEEFHSELKKSALKPGDLGIVRTGYPGTAAVIPDTLPISNCSDLVIVRPGDQVLSPFLALVFNSTFGKQTVAGVLVGAAQKHFNVTAAKAALVPIPSREEQARVVIESSEVRQECEKLESICQQKLKVLAELKQSLLQKSFSGELTVTPQDEIETALA